MQFQNSSLDPFSDLYADPPGAVSEVCVLMWTFGKQDHRAPSVTSSALVPAGMDNIRSWALLIQTIA